MHLSWNALILIFFLSPLNIIFENFRTNFFGTTYIYFCCQRLQCAAHVTNQKCITFDECFVTCLTYFMVIGPPKGAILTHANLVADISAYRWTMHQVCRYVWCFRYLRTYNSPSTYACMMLQVLRRYDASGMYVRIMLQVCTYVCAVLLHLSTGSYKLSLNYLL